MTTISESMVKLRPEVLWSDYKEVRSQTENLCEPLKPEDYIPQPMQDVSPPKWHLAHTTWFFEEFLLKKFLKGYKEFDESFSYLFNSYYNNVGDKWERAKRGQLSRPYVEEVYSYRAYVDSHLQQILEQESNQEELSRLLLIGINHEQQHQELLLSDIKYILGNNPVFPIYRPENQDDRRDNSQTEFLRIEEGLYEIGYQGNGFHFDNEKPVHKVFLKEFAMSSNLVTNGEYLEFINDGGYEDFNLWLDDGWIWLQVTNKKSPLYWHRINGKWNEFTLHGLEKLDYGAPVSHLSFYEAQAFAKWKGLDLPTEAQWEIAARLFAPGVKDDEQGISALVPGLTDSTSKMKNAHGNLWQWTYSGYFPYPGFKAEKGALGEYNGKFMINQMVLRGGSFATPPSHYRPEYRNFWHPDKQFQFTGIRLVKN